MTNDTASRRKDTWTSEQDETIKRMRVERQPWKAIASAVDRTVEAVCGRYSRLLPKQERLRYRTIRRWTPEEEEQLLEMVGEGKSIEHIANVTKQPRKSIYNKLEYLNRPRRSVHFDRIPRLVVPPSRLADRDRRMAAEMDLTSEFFGDPRPGQSALDKREQRA